MRLILALVAIVVLIVGGGVFYIRSTFPPFCENTVIATVPSPDARQNAVLFVRNCGATSAFSSELSILPADGGLQNMAGNTFIATGGESATETTWGGPALSAAWTQADRLTVRYDPTARTIKSEAMVEGVSVDYLPGAP